MKSFLIFVAVIISVQALSDKQKNEFKMVKGEDGINIYTYCKEDSEVDDKELHQSLDGKFEPDVYLKLFYYCYFKETGILSESGDVYEGNYEDFLMQVLGFTNPMADKIIDNCRPEKDSPRETAYQFMKCIIDLSDNGRIGQQPK